MRVCAARRGSQAVRAQWGVLGEDGAGRMLVGRLGGLVVVVVVVSTASAGCGVAPEPLHGTSGSDLDGLPVIQRPRDNGTYRSAYFGPAWANVDKNSCRQRADVLYESRDPTRPFKTCRVGTCDHEMVAETWQDPYTGRVRTFANLRDPQQAKELTIDHVKSARATRRAPQEC